MSVVNFHVKCDVIQYSWVFRREMCFSRISRSPYCSMHVCSKCSQKNEPLNTHVMSFDTQMDLCVCGGVVISHCCCCIIEKSICKFEKGFALAAQKEIKAHF